MTRREHAATRRWRRRIEPLAPALLHLMRLQPEDEDIVRADVLADLDIGAVERADGQRAVERELHVARAGGFHARRSRSARTDRPPE